MKTSLGLQHVPFVTFLEEKNVLLLGSFKLLKGIQNRIKSHYLKNGFIYAASFNVKSHSLNLFSHWHIYTNQIHGILNFLNSYVEHNSVESSSPQFCD